MSTGGNPLTMYLENEYNKKSKGEKQYEECKHLFQQNVSTSWTARGFMREGN